MRDVKTGLITLAILYLLVRGKPMHGYGIRRVLAEILGSMPPESTVYDALKRLERLGLVRSF
jgi:DNA-binding PadR family transcriptional regulator